MEQYKVNGVERIRVCGEFMDIDIDLSRINDNLSKAQFALDTQVMASMIPLMPRQTGNFVQMTNARSAAAAGTGYVWAGTAPFGRFLYYGKVMVDPLTRSAYARKGVKKVVTDKDLHFWYPTAVAKWFEVAKERNINDWIGLVKKTVGGK